jgi:hypothetical protein
MAEEHEDPHTAECLYVVGLSESVQTSATVRLRELRCVLALLWLESYSEDSSK